MEKEHKYGLVSNDCNKLSDVVKRFEHFIDTYGDYKIKELSNEAAFIFMIDTVMLYIKKLNKINIKALALEEEKGTVIQEFSTALEVFLRRIE